MNSSVLFILANIAGFFTSPVLKDFRLSNSLKSPPCASFIDGDCVCVSVVSVLGGVSPTVPSTVLVGSG